MNSEAIFNAAHSTAIQLLESGAFVSPADTVCALQTASGRIFTGVSCSDMNSSVHAEVDAVRNMLAAGEKIIQAILLISTTRRMPLLPCNNCVGYILSLAPENSGCVVMMQDRVINLPEVARFAAPAGAPSEPRQFGAPMGNTSELRQFGAPMGNTSELRPFAGQPAMPRPQPAVNVKPFVPPVQEQLYEDDGDDSETTTANTKNAYGDLLKNKVQNIMNVAEDDDDEEFLNSLPTKKKRFGFLKK